MCSSNRANQRARDTTSTTTGPHLLDVYIERRSVLICVKENTKQAESKRRMSTTLGILNWLKGAEYMGRGWGNKGLVGKMSVVT